jgi:hypothetical protein
VLLKTAIIGPGVSGGCSLCSRFGRFGIWR